MVPPNVKSSEQIGRGLYGPLIVDKKSPPKVDFDITWVLDGWRMSENGQIDPSFHQIHDMIHGVQMGNITTLNGKNSETFNVCAGERIRLRLINVANTCSFALNFECHFSQVTALDGQPIKPLRQSPVKLN